MATNTKKQFKVNTLSKDFDIKLKDIAGVMKGTSYDVSAQAFLDGEAFDVFFNRITKESQIVGIDDYINGAPLPATDKPVQNNASEQKNEQSVKQENDAKPEKKPAPQKANQEKSKDARESAAKDVRPVKPVQPAQPKNEPQSAAAPADKKNNQQKKNDMSRFDRTAVADTKKVQPQQKKADAPRVEKKSTVKVGTNVNNAAPKAEAKNDKETVRVVDTRTASFDLSKYDDKLNDFVPDAVGNDSGKKKQKKVEPVRNPEGRRGGKDVDDMPQQGKGAFGSKNAQNNKNNKKNQQNNNRKPAPEPVKQKLHVSIPDEITVGELASRLKVTAGEVIKRLMMMGIMATINQTVDFDTAFLVADELGAEVEKEVVVTIEEKLFDTEEDTEESLVERAPVVCVMGHVDHGKTSLLDAIRKTNVTRGEAGGITQHIGAYRVNIGDKKITFLDTPGHEAFTAMRARGAMATDIAILVVAADDGIMPQTVEAINHAKQAGVDIIVAINKMDKPTANPDVIKQELTQYELVPEEWGGDVICVPVSALTGMGIEDLLENVLLVAEVKELKANPNRHAKGIVIEARLDKGRGPVATVLVQNGTLRSGDIIIAGTSVGRVRAMTDHNGKLLKKAGPSVPVEITGLAEVPLAGDEFNAVEDEKMARTLAEQRRAKAKEEQFKINARANLNDLFSQISAGAKDLNIIVKADVGGSVEAVKQSLEKLSNDEVKVKVIHGAAGGITEGDVTFAAASNAIIVGFNVRPDKQAVDTAERNKVDIRTYRVIYECIEEVEAAMKGMLAPKFKEVVLGRAEVRQTIRVPNVGVIAGSYITDGKVTRNALIRVVRDGVVIFEDKISSLRRFKDDVREVAQGYECGIGLERFGDIKEGDILEASIMEEIER